MTQKPLPRPQDGVTSRSLNGDSDADADVDLMVGLRTSGMGGLKRLC